MTRLQWSLGWRASTVAVSACVLTLVLCCVDASLSAPRGRVWVYVIDGECSLSFWRSWNDRLPRFWRVEVGPWHAPRCSFRIYVNTHPRRFHRVDWAAPAPLVVVMASAPFLWFAGRRDWRWQARLGACPKCGYDMRAAGSLLEVCPECGGPAEGRANGGEGEA